MPNLLRRAVIATAIALAGCSAPIDASTDPTAAVSISIAPQTATVSPSGSVTFAAAVSGAQDPGVTWNVVEVGGGSVDAQGVYTAPGQAGTYHVRATSKGDPSKGVEATVAVVAPPPPEAVSVAIDPPAVVLTAGGTQQFTAIVTGTANAATTWTVQEGSAGGGVTSTGLYTAPSAAGVFHVVVTSVADATKQASATISVSAGGSGSTFVSAYYVGYQRSLYPPDKVDFTAFTHLMMGRVTPRTDGTLTTNFDIDDVNGPLLAKDLSARAHAAGRKAILMVGGAGQHTNWLAASADATRATFVTNLLRAMSDLGYDGLDLDWEPINTTDMPQLEALVRELRAASPTIILTLPVKWVRSTNTSDPVPPFVASVASLFDQINIMSYSMTYWASGWESWHSSALFGETPTTPSSVASSADAYANAGVPKAKIGVGIGFFGQCWRGPTAPHQAVSAAPVAGDNTMSYANVVTGYLDAPRLWDSVAKVPYRSSATPVGAAQCTFISYEDEQSVLEKGAYVKASGLGGAIIWTVNQGYVSSLAANPILDAVKQGFLR
jgi:chitinase